MYKFYGNEIVRNVILLKNNEIWGIGNSEDKDVVCNNCILNSKQSEICNIYLKKNRNFNYELYVCNECHIATIHTESLGEINIVVTKKGT